MKVRPKALAWISLLLLCVSIGLPLQIMIRYGHWPWELSAIAAKMAPLNWVLFLLAPITAGVVFRASPWARLLAPTICVLVAYNNWLVAQVHGPESWLPAAASTSIFLGLMGTLAFGHAASALANPQRRWWLVRRRFRHQVPIRVCFVEREGDARIRELLASLDLVGHRLMPTPQARELLDEDRPALPGEFTLSTFDLSETGAFVSLAGVGRFLERMRLGSRCYVIMPLGKSEKIVCQAEIVRKEAASGQYPAGIGLRFRDMGWMAQRRLGAYLARLEAQKLQSSSRVETQDEKKRSAA